MEAAVNQPVRLNQHHIDPKRDERRNKQLVRMEVVNRNTLALEVLENTIGPGKHIVTVYDDEVPKVMAMVEPSQDLVDQAQAAYELEVAEQVAKNIGHSSSAEDMLRVVKTNASEDAVREYKRLERTSPLSPQGMFRRRNKRDMKPLVSAKKIEGSEHAEPQVAELENERKRTAGALSDALKGAVQEVIAALRSGPAPSEADIDARVEAKVRELLGEKQGASPKKS